LRSTVTSPPQVSTGEVITQVKDLVDKLSEEEISKRLNTKVKEEFLFGTKIDVLDLEIVYTKKRIEAEAYRASRYGAINLMIGFITTFMAIFFLGYSLMGVQTNNVATSEFIYHLIPRLSLSILIEVFSFFFLRLYKKNLDDIKYLNNERTNIEMKMIAIKTAFLYNDTELMTNVATKLADTERNFILKKGESTLEIEKEKLESKSNGQFVSSVVRIFESIKGGNGK
jgi:hypothetical protein